MTASDQFPGPLAICDAVAFEAIAHVCLMGAGSYATPEDMAFAMLKRLAHEGYVVTKYRSYLSPSTDAETAA